MTATSAVSASSFLPEPHGSQPIHTACAEMNGSTETFAGLASHSTAACGNMAESGDDSMARISWLYRSMRSPYSRRVSSAALALIHDAVDGVSCVHSLMRPRLSHTRQTTCE